MSRTFPGDSRLRVLVVTTWFPEPGADSRTPFCLDHVHSLLFQGYEVSVVHVPMRRRQGLIVTEIYRGVRVTRAPLGLDPLRLARTVGLIAARLRRCDVLHTMAFSSALVSALAWCLVRRRWVHTEHWNGVIEPASVGGVWPRLSFLRHILRLPHAVTAVTHQLADAIAPFARKGSVSVVPCVVRGSAAPAPFPGQPPLRLVAVGLLIPRKNPLLALETIAWLVLRGVDVRYTWVGSGPLLAQARLHARRLQIEDRVEFVGAVAPEDVPLALSKAHLFFLPSLQENFFTAAAEAICAGRPVVAPLSGGFDDYCNLANAVIAKSWSVDDLGSAVLEARERFKDVSPMDLAATVAGRFSTAAVGRAFAGVYASIGCCRAGP